VNPSNWPLAGLRVRTPRLELRYPDDALLDELIDVAAAGIHDPADMPFYVPWTERPPGEFERGFLQYHWGRRAAWTPDEWSLELAVIVDGRAVGMQGMGAKSYAVLREVGTGSWLSRPLHGQGLGKEMRAAVLHLAFAGLGAEFATTDAYEDNPASRGVTRSLGYAEDGEANIVRRGVRARMLRYRMDRVHWETIRRNDIAIDGLAAALPMFGLGLPTEPAGAA
jgi:RimJ/RimL family protein N-acetyltransferase